jgi:hypothetical protein
MLAISSPTDALGGKVVGCMLLVGVDGGEDEPVVNH